ncbi:hypothetical protein GCM10020366_69920 [Saccharopolyspora gregorii]|uniref:Uncharacterized protein n=1 Tax=Saccharopolyspora gregorii TaxID=33914 RepID=A0ABP6S2S5_9PSEU
MPVEVVVGEVEHDPGLRGQRPGPVQLEAGQLDGEHPVPGAHRVDDGQPDVPAGDDVEPGGAQHRFEHGDGGGLAVGAGDGEPVGGFGPRPVEPPGEFDLADDLDARGGGGGQQRRAGPPAGTGDDEVGPGGRFEQSGQEPTAAGADGVERGEPFFGRVGDGDFGTGRQQRFGGRAAGHPGTRDQHPPVPQRSGHRTLLSCRRRGRRDRQPP